jgi:hypothetical protein
LFRRNTGLAGVTYNHGFATSLERITAIGLDGVGDIIGGTNHPANHSATNTSSDSAINTTYLKANHSAGGTTGAGTFAKRKYGTNGGATLDLMKFNLC